MSGVKNEAAFLRKIPIFGKKPENSSEIMFFFFCPKLNHYFLFFPKKMVQHNMFYNLVKALCLRKIYFSSYGPMCSNYSDYRIFLSPVSMKGIINILDSSHGQVKVTSGKIARKSSN